MRLGMYQDQPMFITQKNEQYWGLPIKGYDSIDAILQDWINFSNRYSDTDVTANIINDSNSVKIDLDQLQIPVSKARQIPTIGLNFYDINEPKKSLTPKLPNIFNKFSSSISGPNNSINLPSDMVDWTSELVIVMGKGGRNIKREDFEDSVAGYMIGTDFSDRKLEKQDGDRAQVSISKSYENFTPTGPFITTDDEVGDLVGSSIVTKLNGDLIEEDIISQMNFDVPTIIEYVSSIIELYPGDLIFAGAPYLNKERLKRNYLQTGDIITSSITNLGEITTTVK